MELHCGGSRSPILAEWLAEECRDHFELVVVDMTRPGRRSSCLVVVIVDCVWLPGLERS